MKNLLKKFQKILLVEIEDLHDDLDLFIEVINDRHREHQITDYVYNENLAILRNEVLGLEDCFRGCAELEAGDVTNAAELAAALKTRFRERLASHGYVPALNSLLAKRIDKIAAYLTLEESVPGAVRPPTGTAQSQSPVQSAG
ncbi:hypothetical protein [Salinispira pacifica]